MTDEKITRFPGQSDDAEPAFEEDRESDGDAQRPAPDGGDNPLMREGPDAPDAADIEDPDEQL
jgi:hypothetical protein